MIATMIWTAVFSPLLGSILNGLLLRKMPKEISHGVACTAMFVAAVCATLGYITYWPSSEEALTLHAFNWIATSHFRVDFSLILDRLSGFMMLIVLWIGSLIHLFAGGYMAEEKTTYRFFSYLNLFVFMMLLLVLGSNMLVMFVGWEGVGLCSYLLIGYWFSNQANAAAGMKAFIVNRIGDIGFILGIFMTFVLFGTLNFTELRDIVLNNAFDPSSLTMITLITLALFIGATGKSAQIPLYIWLPDAMAGPTPVSALIHAATMVTAGIYMMCRLNFLFYLSPFTMNVIATVGAATAFFAATIAIVQTDIKKVLAYSTVSQLGYMVLACGVGAFHAGFFHVFTHACFKALLFLGAGSVIVAMHHKQDMCQMGGLRRYMPITYFCFMMGWLAIIGTPLFSGFFSKDEILWYSYLRGGFPLWSVGAMTAGLTAFYMSRLFFLTFHGPNRSDEKTRAHLHETSWVMWLPLAVLAVASVFAGYIGLPGFTGLNLIHHYFEPVIIVPDLAKDHWSFLHEHHSLWVELGLMLGSISLAGIGVFYAYRLYAHGPSENLESYRKKFGTLYQLLHDKYYVDEIYQTYIVAPLKDAALFLYRIFDVKLIDGLVNATAQGIKLVSAIISFNMSGSVHRHAMVFVVGLICILTVLIF